MKLFTLPIVFQIDWLKGGKTEKPSVISETVASQIDRLKGELEAKKENKEEAARIRNEILGLKRELNRTKQFTSIAWNKNIEGKNDLDSISARNLMRVDKEVSKEKRGEFLSKSFLYKRSTDSEGIISEEPTDGRNLKEGDVFFVDFGKNKSANMRIGLWQMLWVDIGYVKVNGQIGVRSIINNRVGYYTKPSADGYIPVFTGDTVSIPTVDEIRSFEEKKDAKLVRNSDQKASDEANDKYITLLESMKQSGSVEVNVNTHESYAFWISKGFTHEQACGIIANEDQESSFNPKSVNGNAVGIFQWMGERKTTIQRKYEKDILTMSHLEQLEAAYWEMTSTSESKVLDPLKQAKSSEEAARIFVQIYERPGDLNSEIQIRGAKANTFEMLLDPNGKSRDLWDYVVNKGPASTGDDSCGVAVRELLKWYGITGLPESGADWKNWDNILDKRPDQFFKVKIGHPNEAYPGAILNYEGTGTLWSTMNHRYGHVEIKGSDGKYYSFYGGVRPGGSAATNEKDPEKFKELTGFTGYAYYPKKTVKS